MDLFRMKCFNAAVEQKNLTRAAELMNITQPAMSFNIREIEKELGIKLFERDNKGIFPTPAGQFLSDGFKQLLASYDKLIERAAVISGGRQRLIIGYHGPVYWAGVPDFVADFSGRHPDIEIVVMQQHWKELANFLRIGAVDIAFLSTDEVQKNDVSKVCHLFREQTCFALAADDPLAKKSSLRYEDIRERYICMNNHPSASMEALINRLYATGIKPEQMRFSPVMESTLAMAACRKGIASLPRSFRVEIPGMVQVDYDQEESWIDYSLASSVKAGSAAAELFMREAAEAEWPYLSK